MLRKNTHNKQFGILREVLPAVASTLTMFVLLAGRILYTGDQKYGYLLWNVFLAWLAWVLGLLLVRAAYATNTQKLTRWGLFFAWLFFLPNTFYLLTDMIHPVVGYPSVAGFNGSDFSSLSNGVMIVFDVSLVGLGVWVGWFLGIKSLMSVHHFIVSKVGKFRATVSTELIIVASAFAVYLGRSPRLNSWDLLLRPLTVLRTVLDPIFRPIDNVDAYALTSLFVILINVIFWSVYSASSNVKVS